MMEVVDVGPEGIEVGTPLKLTYRIKERDRTRGYNRYFWKATPVATGAYSWRRESRTRSRSWVWAVRVSASVGMPTLRSEEHTSELQSLMRISSAVFCLKKKTHRQ